MSLASNVANKYLNVNQISHCAQERDAHFWLLKDTLQHLSFGLRLRKKIRLSKKDSKERSSIIGWVIFQSCDTSCLGYEGCALPINWKISVKNVRALVSMFFYLMNIPNTEKLPTEQRKQLFFICTLYRQKLLLLSFKTGMVNLNLFCNLTWAFDFSLLASCRAVLLPLARV